LFKAKLYSGPVLVLAALQFIEANAFGIPLSYFPNYAIELGATVALIGVFTSSFMLASAIMSTKLGSLSDKHGRKKIIMVGLIGDVIFGTLTGLVPSWEWLLLVRIFNGAVSGAAMLAGEALLIDVVSPSRWGEASGFVMSLGMVGRIIGPLFGGTIQWTSVSFGLSLLDSYRVPYFVDSGMAVLALLLVSWKIQESKPSKTQTQSVKIASSSKRIKTPISFSFKVLLVHAFMTGMGMGFIMPIMTLFYIDKFGIEPVEIGLLITISGFVGIIGSWIAGRLSDKSGRKPFIAAGSLTARISDIALPLTGNVVQAAGVASIRDMGFNIGMPPLRALRADITPLETRGRYFGMFMTAFTAGDVIAPIVSTYIYAIYSSKSFEISGLVLPGYGLPFFINAILGIAATLMLLVLVKEPSRDAKLTKGQRSIDSMETQSVNDKNP
jgi:MFS family permease